MELKKQFELYPYQERIVDAIRVSIKKHNRVLVYASTGAGKTKISQYIIEKLNDNGKKTLFTTPRIKLAVQTQASFGFGNLILGDKSADNGSNCTIASVQSLYSRKITEHFDLIFIDECHFAHGSEYMDYIFDTWPNTKIIGLSATPIDEKGYLLHGYDDIVNEISVNELVNLGFLTGVDVYTSPNQPKTETINIVNGDYNQTQASEVVREETVLSNAISEWEKYARDKKTIVFACDIKHADALTERFNAMGVKAGRVHSKMTTKAIELAYQQFKDNIIQVLINVDMATFGFDEPSITCMAFLRPIKSLRLYKQMVGRGIRKYPGKETCLMLDCANVVLDNGFPLDEINFIKKPVINKTIDRLANVERDIDGTISPEKHTKERIEYLEKIGSLIDLYKDKVYKKETDLMDDMKTILTRGGYFKWRQNSGKMFKDGRWVHFTDKNGLPDFTLIFKGSIYIGLEAKLPKGRLTKHQEVTFPEMTENGTLFFIIENVIDLFETLEHLLCHIKNEDGTFINPSIYDVSDTQLAYRKKLKLPVYNSNQ